VYEELRHKIIYGELLPGQSVTLRNLAEQFGVSFIPVREALWQLETEKVVLIERNKSFRVNTLTARELEEALSIRLVLEARVAERACEVRSDDVVPRLERLLKDMEKSANRPREYLLKNSEFHFTIYNAADMPVHMQLINQLWARIGPYLYIQAKEMIPIMRSNLYHNKMAAALAARDKKELVKMLRQDLTAAARFIKDRLD
jgi:DNA-binding GntR family transcriptional regulator